MNKILELFQEKILNSVLLRLYPRSHRTIPPFHRFDIEMGKKSQIDEVKEDPRSTLCLGL